MAEIVHIRAADACRAEFHAHHAGCERAVVALDIAQVFRAKSVAAKAEFI